MWNRSVRTILILACCACWCSADPIAKGGDLPSLTGATFDGSQVELPAAVHGKVALLVFSFTKASGTPSSQWSRWFWSEFGGDPKAISYSLIFLENVPWLLRGWVASSIKKGIPKDRIPFSLRIDKEEKDWQKHLGVTEKDHAYLVLLSPDGEVLQLHHGPFEKSESERLARDIRNALATPVVAQ